MASLCVVISAVDVSFVEVLHERLSSSRHDRTEVRHPLNYVLFRQECESIEAAAEQPESTIISVHIKETKVPDILECVLAKMEETTYNIGSCAHYCSPCLDYGVFEVDVYIIRIANELSILTLVEDHGEMLMVHISVLPLLVINHSWHGRVAKDAVNNV